MSTSAQEKTALAELRHKIRHSASHVMADAITSIWPDAKLTIGPPTEDGFYYDIDLDHHITSEELKQIEVRMKKIMGANQPFVCDEISREDAMLRFADNGYKLESIENVPEGEPITTYTHGSFTDLCEGPHVNRTGDIKAVKLLNVAGAYWRGDESNKMLQRIYGTAFESKKDLHDYLHMLEESARRDHRKLGRELELVMFDPVAPATPFFLPKGTVVYNLLVDYIRDIYRRQGFQEVITPQIFSSDLWKTSGHYDNFRENMYFLDVDDREFAVKPMNCPGHAMMFRSRLHSYRDLPLRYADFGRLHRNERSGVTHGLTRVRSFAQDDAHIFCMPEQIEPEIANFVETLRQTYDLFGFDDVRIYLSLRPDKHVGTDETWTRAEEILNKVLSSQQLDFELMPGEGAFYGPKIDFYVNDALNREWQLGTLQLDFSLPERFDLEYITEEGIPARPAIIHRALLGSLDRFMGILIEHVGGAFPTWLAPVQTVVIPIADRHVEYAREIESRVDAAGLRVEVDARTERMNLKIREAQLQKIPFMLVVGDREKEEDVVAVRDRSGENLGVQSLDAFIQEVKEQVSSKF